MQAISTNKIVKVGIIVNDIEQAVKTYADLFGLKEVPAVRVPKSDLPPSDPNAPAYTLYRGEYRNTGCKTALIPMEPIYIELIEPLKQPSPWTEFQEKHGQGVHYLAYNIEGFDEHIELLESKGMPVVQRTEKGHERYAYFETENALGVTIEFKEIGEKQTSGGDKNHD
ncbi:VOC family protein [Paenibacillus eucommiae]|uniref:Catechol 2,3-dioxygenase-like lactoylglutathione lyase family enzyme n=1 Tax=Paenibacillus eucommiae TaxID=1355755 RepID=A0ABS4J821_9BACL|nr:VOC family protein [Paenibacillus eucommiae]MBP1995988.1 catechol 2,3-dioxygenase-like lactoylglutathione lyase family enzyme [Paenibacillus eucommiae]